MVYWSIGLGVGVRVLVGVGVFVGVGVSVGEGVMVGVAVKVGVWVWGGVAVIVGDGVAEGACPTGVAPGLLETLQPLKMMANSITLVRNCNFDIE
jgi:hypothetical protein